MLLSTLINELRVSVLVRVIFLLPKREFPFALLAILWLIMVFANIDCAINGVALKPVRSGTFPVLPLVLLRLTAEFFIPASKIISAILLAFLGVLICLSNVLPDVLPWSVFSSVSKKISCLSANPRLVVLVTGILEHLPMPCVFTSKLG